MLLDHLEKLRAFHLTATEKSFLRAAQRLGITQPAVTKAVKLLEIEMNATLLVRHARGVALTPKGMLLNEFCESLFLRVRDLEQKLVNSEVLSGVVRIGTYETLGELFWPRALTELSKIMPGVIVELTTEQPETHLAKLEVGALDIVVDAEPRILENLYSRVLYSDWFGVFLKKDSPLRQSVGSVPISYVKRAVDRKNIPIEYHLKRQRGEFDLRYCVESFTMVRSLVSEGLCVGVLPLRLANNLLKTDSIVPFAPTSKYEHFGEHRICATCVDDLKKEPKISKVIDLLRVVAVERNI